jgi:hypothetical protein
MKGSKLTAKIGWLLRRGHWCPPHRNNIHTEMIEEAAADRVLFLNEASQSVRHVDLRFPEYVSFLACRADMMECVARNKRRTSWLRGFEYMGTAMLTYSR